MPNRDQIQILLVDDQKESVEPLLDLLEEEDRIASRLETDFDQARQGIAANPPDLLVLDLVGPDNRVAGVEVSKSAWRDYFCPIVIYSAVPEKHDVAHRHEAFVEHVQKGRGSEDRALAAIMKFVPFAEELRAARRRVNRLLAISMRDAAAPVLDVAEPEEAATVLMRAAQRRVAAMLDVRTEGGGQQAWEQYLCPVVSTAPLTGDILRRREATSLDPSAYRVVLSPSCDMARGGGKAASTAVVRRPDASEADADACGKERRRGVLVARCCSVGSGRAETLKAGVRKLQERLPSLLNQGHFDMTLPFPELSGRIPTMIADLRDLELVDLDDVVRGDGKFERVASLDSPYRELVSWAYMRAAARPGLPDRDTESWAEEIIHARTAGGSGSQ